jgi:hypothetical protein
MISVVLFVSQAIVEGVEKRRKKSNKKQNKTKQNKTIRPKHRPPRLGIWGGSIGCITKLAISGLNIDNQSTSWTNLSIWK